MAASRCPADEPALARIVGRSARARTDVTAPFAPGSVSVGLHPVDGADATDQVQELLDEAQAIDGAGFDGVTLAEHHVGFPGYLPQPLLAVSWLLDAAPGVWAAPAPILLGLRHPRLLAEELAWTAARFPHRVGAALAAGYARSDFDAIGVAFDKRRAAFEAKLDELLAALDPDGPLTGDSAVDGRLVRREHLLLAANSPEAARRAAELSLGMLFPGGEPADRLGRLTETYRNAGGGGPVVGIAVVWIGEQPTNPNQQRIDERYIRAAAPGMRQAAGFRRGPFTGTPSAVADELAAHIQGSGMTALNVRLRAANEQPDEVRDHIHRAGGEIVPSVRAALTTTRQHLDTNAQTFWRERGHDS